MKNILFFLLFLAGFISAQNVRTSTVTAGSTYGTLIKLTDQEIPLAVYADSINTITSVSFYVLIGDTAGIGTDSSKYMPLTLMGDTTAYSVPLTRLKIVPLNSSLFYSLFPNPNQPGNTNGRVYLLPKLAAAQTLNKVIKIRVGIGANPTGNDLSLSQADIDSLQNIRKLTGTDSVTAYLTQAMIDSLQAVSIQHPEFSLPSGFSGNFTHFGITDTLYGYNAADGAKDTITIDVNAMAKSITIGIKDTGTVGGSGGLIDSLAVDVYIPLLASWVTLTNGLFRLYDGLYTSGDVVVPGNGLYKEYYIVGEYIDQIRVRWVYPLSPAKTDRKVPLTVYGSN